MIKRAKVTYSSLRKTLEKQTKAIEDQVKKQIKANEYDVKQLVESNELIDNDFDIEKDSLLHKEKNNEVVEERASKFNNSKKRVNPDNLIYK